MVGRFDFESSGPCWAVGPDGEMGVIDNQGVFNPSNEFIRVQKGAFYGHYLLKRDDNNIAAFQPEDVDSEVGGLDQRSGMRTGSGQPPCASGHRKRVFAWHEEQHEEQMGKIHPALS